MMDINEDMVNVRSMAAVLAAILDFTALAANVALLSYIIVFYTS